MNMSTSRRARIPGVMIGTLLLVAVFILPFGYKGARPLTLYDIFQQNIDVIKNSPQYMTPIMYLLTLDFVLLVIAGLLGTFPKLSGLIAIMVMSSFSIVAYLLFGQDMGYGIGYYFIWVVSLVALGNAFWGKLERVIAR
jgi:hypothetical protein